MTIEVRDMTEEDRSAFAIPHQAFNHRYDPEEHREVSLRDRHVALLNGRPVGHLRVFRTGQYFGGRRVNSSGFAAVAVAPEARGRGVSTALLTHSLRRLRDAGVAVSTLYPSTMAPYRKVGFELGGAHHRYRVPVTMLPHAAATDELEMWEDADLDDIKRCLASFAETSTGLFERVDEFWGRMLEKPSRGRLYRYRVRSGEETTGYVIYTQAPDGSGGAEDDRPYSLACRDLVWTNADSARALLGFAAAHRTLATALTWAGGADEPLAALLPDAMIEMEDHYHWMFRVLDVTAALEGRGYPEHLEASLALQIDDDLLGENSGAIEIDIAGGHARVSPAGSAKARVSIRWLSAMFTGWLLARDAVRLGGLMAGATDVATLEAMFAGPRPWLIEDF